MLTLFLLPGLHGLLASQPDTREVKVKDKKAVNSFYFSFSFIVIIWLFFFIYLFKSFDFCFYFYMNLSQTLHLVLVWLILKPDITDSRVTCWMFLVCVCVCDKALQSLGCSHVLETYLQGLSVEGFASVESLREIQYEAAWRNSKWDLELAMRY